MPALSNAKHELFAQGLAKGETAIAAYEAAGYKPDRGAASRLSANVSIEKRVSEIQERAAIRTELTMQDILDELEEARRLASTAATPQTSAMVAASLGKAKLLGFVTDKNEVSGPNGGPIPIQTIELVGIKPT